ncbi:MAG TPA: hypothetical protein VEQ40_11250 [Pyrinomonadaceae bacterium]|nr:hypothetical protein [Pyrinomonadaceae bacterium]
MEFTQDFLEKALLIVITATSTGLVIPIVLKRIDRRRLKEEKENDERRDQARKIFEAELARQSTILEAQSKFLDDISKIFWTWRYMNLKVVYYGSKDNQEEKYRQAKGEFDKRIWDVFNEMRREISRSRRLISEEAYKKLIELLRYLQEIDSEVSELVEAEFDGDSIKKYAELYERRISNVSEIIDEALNDLAQELRLKGSQTARTPASASVSQSDSL